MNNERRVVCAGVLVADHLCTPISHLPASGELVQADELILNIGGCASNAAVALAKLGVRATLCGRVGDDVFGRFVSDSLLGFGIDVSAITVDPDLATSQTLIVNVKGEDRRFIHSFGANEGLTASDLDPLLSRRPKVLYVGGFLILPGLDALELANREAKHEYEREHTTPFLWDNPQRFRIGNVSTPDGVDYSLAHRWTIDYDEDYRFLQAIFETLYLEHPRFTYRDLIAFLGSRPDITAINAHLHGVSWYRHHLHQIKHVNKH